MEEEAVQRSTEQALELVGAEELGEAMAAELEASMPELGGSADEDFRAGLRRSCVSNVREVFRALRSGADPASISPPADATAWAYELVHRGLPIATLLRAYRLGHAVAQRQLELATAELDVPADLRWRVLAHTSRTFFAYVDAASTQLVDEYEQERARWIRGAAAARSELVGKIIDRQPIDPPAASRTLRYEVDRCHLAFIVWWDARAEGTPETGSLELAAGELARELGGGAVLLVPIGERVVWGWTAGERARLEATDRARPMPAGLRAALGQPGEGAEGMAASHEQARAARRVAELMALRPGSVVRYGAVALISLLTADPAAAVRFTTAQLGALAGDNDAAARLRATLRIYLEENLSPARAARRLGIHQNTVVYRVRRAEEILGRTVDDGRLELEVSLRLAEGLPALRAAR